MDGRRQILNWEITWSPTRVKHGWLAVSIRRMHRQATLFGYCVYPPHAPSSNSVRVGFYYELTRQFGHNKVIRKVVQSWAHLSSPVSVSIPTLVLSQLSSLL